MFVFEVGIAVVAIVPKSIFPSIETIVTGLLFKQSLCGEEGVDDCLTLFGVGRWGGELADGVGYVVAE